MKPQDIHITCVRHVSSLGEELQYLYPRVRLKYVLKRKPYGSKFWFRIQVRKKWRHNEYFWENVSTSRLSIHTRGQVNLLMRYIDFIRDECHNLYISG